jgi:hypothetical protein
MPDWRSSSETGRSADSAGLELLRDAGGVAETRKKSLLLTGYLEHLLTHFGLVRPLNCPLTAAAIAISRLGRVGPNLHQCDQNSFDGFFHAPTRLVCVCIDYVWSVVLRVATSVSII